MATSAVDLLWLPLGAGDTSGLVRWSGRAFEALSARREHRRPCQLVHSALEVHLGGHTYAVEMTPAWGLPKDVDRGIAVTGPVGLTGLDRLRLFRYEVHGWKDGAVPDADEAIGEPCRVSDDWEQARSVLRLLPDFPPATWGRDGQATGDMWNSNSLTSWLLARSGHDLDHVRLPAHVRAPGWTAGLVVAARESERAREAAACERPAPR